MSDFVRLPIGEGMIRVKYETAEWSPTKTKLILKGLIEWYCEGDPDKKGATKDGMVMIGAADVKFPVTNPVRFGLEWGTKENLEGKSIPDYLMGKPLDAWEEVAVTQSKAKGGGYKGGGGAPKLTPAGLDAAIAYTISAMGEPGVKESGLTADKVLGCAMFVDWNKAPAAAPPAEAPPEVDESQIPF